MRSRRHHINRRRSRVQPVPNPVPTQRRLDRVSYIIEKFLELGNKTWPVSLCSEEMSVPNLCPVRKLQPWDTFELLYIHGMRWNIVNMHPIRQVTLFLMTTIGQDAIFHHYGVTDKVLSHNSKTFVFMHYAMHVRPPLMSAGGLALTGTLA